MQKILFAPSSTWQLPNISELPSWKGAKRVSIDTETKDPTLKELGPGVRRGGYIVGVSFCIEDDSRAYYLPIRHATGTNLPQDRVIQYLRQQANDFTGTIVGANLAYDLDYLAEIGIVFQNAQWFRDIQIADPLINELHLKYSLDAIAERWNCPIKSEELLREAASAYRVNAKHSLWALDPIYVGEYAEADARIPLLISRRQEREIEAQELWGIYNLESQVLPVLVKMRRRGVKIDIDRLERIKAWCKSEIQKELSNIHFETGVRLLTDDLSLTAPLVPIFNYLNIPVGKTSKGKPNIDQRLMNSTKEPAIVSLARAKKVLKLLRDFAGSVERHITNGRLHCVFNQVKRVKDGDQDGDDTSGAAYGRLSTEHVNIQQQPARDEFAKEWRSIYLPDDGKLWCSCDFSQQEPRMTTHYAALTRCPGGIAAAQAYRDDPTMDNHSFMTRITGLGDKYGWEKGRKYAKVIFLGLCYGMGGAKLCRSLGLPTAKLTLDNGKIIEVAGEEGQKIIEQFNKQAPYVKALAKKCEARAKEAGVIKTLLGRHCHFPKDFLDNYEWTHKALNRLIQGSSADQTKKAMVDAEASGLQLQLQVHDELCMSVTGKDEAEALAAAMRNSVELRLPMKVDIELGSSWGDSMK